MRHPLITAVALAAVSCGSSTTAPSTALHADVRDPTGDARSDPRVAVAPDLVRVTVDVSGNLVTFSVQMAPGSLDRQTTRVSVLVDTDRNGSTGIRQGDGLGADYAIDMAASTSQATIAQADPAGCDAHASCFTPLASLSMSFITDGMQVTAPLSSFGSSDGRMNFLAHSYTLIGSTPSADLDYVPDVNLAPGHVP
jgi:hypothetical protein